MGVSETKDVGKHNLPSPASNLGTGRAREEHIPGLSSSKLFLLGRIEVLVLPSDLVLNIFVL